MPRPRTYSPEEAARRDKASKARSARRRHLVFNERRRARRSRDAAREKRLHAVPEVADTRSIISARELRRPNLLWIDRHGHVHSERWESAEELIARITKENA